MDFIKICLLYLKYGFLQSMKRGEGQICRILTTLMFYFYDIYKMSLLYIVPAGSAYKYKVVYYISNCR
ncbi:hypothetical protein HMPREF0766_12222 [Sphingobacterium spiritivorum ATCC 33861]|uniref:Uncharacterized protein n=1 Tax=Sphingobacterium spiritivorum ATCC 33861 TaxID=525373 RepID=D7VMK2_SPHSI|nr:hypothetical protein HMPREF0766_12222 [Sphingobacterium spiritivorum ATCC 33861]